MRAIRFAALAGAALLSATGALPAAAQDTQSPAQPPVAPDVDLGGDSITAGIGLATVPTYEGSDQNRLIPAGAVRGSVSGYSFSTRGTRLFVDLVRNDPGPVFDFQLGPVLSLNFNRTGDSDDARIEALGRKKVAFEAGGYIGIGKTCWQ